MKQIIHIKKLSDDLHKLAVDRHLCTQSQTSNEIDYRSEVGSACNSNSHSKVSILMALVSASALSSNNGVCSISHHAIGSI